MIKFGTGGWRDYIGEGFNRENLEKIAQSLASKMKSKHIVVGYDHRFLSEDAAKWVAMVLAGNGKKVTLALLPSPTPSVMLFARDKKLEYGLAITASHNPYNFNGIKIFTKGGKDADATFTNDLEKIIAKVKTVKKINYEDALKKKIITLFELNSYYANNLPNMIDLKLISKSKLKILVDPMNGVAKLSLDEIFKNHRLTLDYINEKRDPLFGGRVPAPTQFNLDQLRTKLLKEKYDLGIALDGDGDRIGIFDNNGNYLDANKLLTITYYYFLEYEKKSGNIVRNLCTTTILDTIAKSYNQKAIETKVGFKYIAAAMHKYQALLGGESSGGLAMKGHLEGKDSIFATLLIIQMLTKSKKSIYELTQEVEAKFGKSTIFEKGYRFSPAKKEKLIKQILTNKKVPTLSFKAIETYYLDGLKIVLEDNQWISLRFSGTEPVLRLMLETKSNAIGEKLIKTFEDYYQL